MLAVQIDRHGPPADVLRTADVPTPTPGRGEVLVRMLASPVNPSDLLYIEGNYGMKPAAFPATPGFEGVGVVEASGGGVLGWLRKGKRVAVIGPRTGAWATHAVASARQVFPVGSIPDEQAAGLFVNPLTAVALTRHVLNVPPGEWLLQTAAGSAVGKMVIALGKRFGFKTLNVVRRREQADELKVLGADVVIVEADGPIDEQAKRHAPDGVKYALDAVGGNTGTAVVKALTAGGRAVCYGLLSGEPVSVHPRFLITGSKRVEGFWLADWTKGRKALAMIASLRQVRGLMAEGVLRADIAATYSLAEIALAAKHAASGAKGGKVLLKIGG